MALEPSFVCGRSMVIRGRFCELSPGAGAGLGVGSAGAGFGRRRGGFGFFVGSGGISVTTGWGGNTVGRSNAAIMGGNGRKNAEGSGSVGGGGITFAVFFLQPAATDNNTTSMQNDESVRRKIIRRSGSVCLQCTSVRLRGGFRQFTAFGEGEAQPEGRAFAFHGLEVH